MDTTRECRRVAIHGSYFARNFGDTLLVRLLCDWSSDIVGRDNVFLAVPGHAEEQKELAYPVATPDVQDTITHLIFAGGGYFGEPALPLRQRYGWYLRNYRRHLSWVGDYSTARRAIFGIGIGPLSDPFFRHAVRQVLQTMDIVYVRDKESRDYFNQYRLANAQARLGIDLAMSLRPVRHSPQYPIGLHITAMPESLLSLVVQVLRDRFRESGGPAPVLLLADSRVPRSFLKSFEALAKNFDYPLNFPEYSGVDNLLEQIANCGTILTSKLHVGIVASALGRKVISLPIHPKTRRFYRDLALGEFCLEGEQQQYAQVAHLLDEAEFMFDRQTTDLKIAEMRGELNRFLRNGADLA